MFAAVRDTEKQNYKITSKLDLEPTSLRMLEASQYQAGQLHNLLGDLQSERVSGFVYIDTTVNPDQKPRSRVLVLKNGELAYGGLKIPSLPPIESLKVTNQLMPLAVIGFDEVAQENVYQQLTSNPDY